MKMADKKQLNDLLTNNATYLLLSVFAGIEYEYSVRCLHYRRINKSKQDPLINLLCQLLKLKMRKDGRNQSVLRGLPHNNDCDRNYQRHSKPDYNVSKVAQTEIYIQGKCMNKPTFTGNDSLKYIISSFFSDPKVLSVKTTSKEIPLNKHKVGGTKTDQDISTQMTNTFFNDLKVVSIKTESKERSLSEHEVIDNKHKLKAVVLNGSSSIADVEECVKSESESYKTGEQNDSRDADSETQIFNLFVKTKQIPTTTPVYHVYMTQVKSHPQTVNGVPWHLLSAEQYRLVTFAQYPHTAQKSAILLANGGFAYNGSGRDSDDTVICFFCCALKQGWRQSDDIQEIHRILSPNCCMVTGANCNNIPMTVPVNGEQLFIQFYSQDNANSNTVQNSRYQQSNELECDGSEDAAAENRNNFTASASHASRDVGPAHVSEFRNTVNQSDVRPDASNISMNQETTRPNATHNQPVNSSASSNSASSNDITVNPSSASVIPNRTPVTSVQQGNINSVSSTEPAAASSRPGAAVQSSAPDRQHTAEQTASSPSQVNQSTQSSATAVAATTAATQSANQPQGNASESTASNSQNTGQSNTKGPTYGELGIITERPKRFEYAVTATRFASFEHWPRDHPLRKEDLADAGFYYAGYGDCARCFYCGGGLRNWEDDDNVWVEHARWFPKCAYIRQTVGQQFVDTVQDLNKHSDKITFKMVTDKMGSSAASFQLDTRSMPLKRDPAVLTVLEMGYSEKDVIEAANYVKEIYSILSSDKVFEKLEMDGKSRNNIDHLAASNSRSSKRSSNPAKDEQVMTKLKEENGQLRQQTVCKICMDKEVAVVFLPCGHFVSCIDCAAAMKDCPVCRKQVRGIVRAFMG